MNDLLALYIHAWTIALSRTGSADGWIGVAALVAMPLAIVFAIRQIVWLLLDGITGGALARQDVERKEARWARRGR